jgi:hypothetical protein
MCLLEFLEITDRAMDSKKKTCNFKSGTTRASAREVVLCQFSGTQNCATVAYSNTFWNSRDRAATLPAGLRFANYMAPDHRSGALAIRLKGNTARK